MTIRQPDPAEAYTKWQAGNSFQKLARNPAPFLVGAPYTVAAVQAACRQEGAFLTGFGPELITDPSFDSPGAWAAGAGWTVSVGAANCDGSQASASDLLNTGSTTVSGITYLVRMVVATLSAGAVAAEVGTIVGTSRTAVGSYSENIAVLVNGATSRLQADLNFVGAVTLFSVREIL